jgi:hypothetical protein
MEMAQQICVSSYTLPEENPQFLDDSRKKEWRYAVTRRKTVVNKYPGNIPRRITELAIIYIFLLIPPIPMTRRLGGCLPSFLALQKLSKAEGIKARLFQPALDRPMYTDYKFKS